MKKFCLIAPKTCIQLDRNFLCVFIRFIPAHSRSCWWWQSNEKLLIDSIWMTFFYPFLCKITTVINGMGSKTWYNQPEYSKSEEMSRLKEKSKPYFFYSLLCPLFNQKYEWNKCEVIIFNLFILLFTVMRHTAYGHPQFDLYAFHPFRKEHTKLSFWFPLFHECARRNKR